MTNIETVDNRGHVHGWGRQTEDAEMTKPQVTTQIAHPRVRGEWGGTVDMSTVVHGSDLWVTSWIEPSSSPAVTGRCHHPTERAAELFARTLVHRGVRDVVVFLGPADHIEGDVA